METFADILLTIVYFMAMIHAYLCIKIYNPKYPRINMICGLFPVINYLICLLNFIELGVIDRTIDYFLSYFKTKTKTKAK